MGTRKDRAFVRLAAVTLFAFAAATALALAGARGRTSRPSAPVVPRIAPPRDLVIEVPQAPPQEPPAAEPSLPAAGEQPLLDSEEQLLAAELATMHTRDAEKLIAAARDAIRDKGADVPLTLMLAIAHAETNGRVLLISEAGAVGLAQATPIAYLMEGGKGKLFVTDDYLVGARAYFLKKPLHDADTVASLLLESPGSMSTARGLLNAAFKYRAEGLAEVETLFPYGSAEFVDAVRRNDDDNQATLEQLESMLDRGASPKELEQFRDEVRGRYRAMRLIQTEAWKRYQKDLTTKRDDMLRKHFGVKPELIIRHRAWEASSYLAAELDERFSPVAMAEFLAEHLQTKRTEAQEIGTAEWELERMTAALYNGGAHNVKRMLSGLITSLPETENYMRKVPTTRLRLDGVLNDYRATRTASATETASK